MPKEKAVKEKFTRRYNAKARNLQAGQKRKADSNIDVIDPRAPSKVEAEPEAARSEGLGKGSARKRRRLESYVAKKLKQERKQELLKELAVTQESYDGSLHLRSTASLGSGLAQSGKQKLERSAQLAERKRERVKSLVGERKRGYHSDSDGESSAEDEDGTGSQDGVVPLASEASTQPAAALPPSALGSGLKAGTKPVIVVRPKRVKTAWAGRPVQTAPEDVGSDSSFDSSDSAYDSMEDEERSEGADAEKDEAEGEDAESWYGFSGEEMEDDGEDGDDGLHLATSASNAKHTGFKAWANAQLDAAKGVQTAVSKPMTETAPRAPKTTKPADGVVRGPLGHDMPSLAPDSLLAGPRATVSVKAVHVDRSDEIQEARLQLPILAEEETIMDAIRQHSVVVICGETGSGKTTQVPQFLYENGFGSTGSDNPGMIAITQPRRVAAVSMAARVGYELNLPPSKVSYQIRYDATSSSSTAIKFMTDGVLLRELSADLLLSRYSVVIVDEAHERTLNTDILIGVLSRAVRLREEDWRAGKAGAPGPLRLIIMSATLRVSDFAENTRLFATPPPVLSVPARQYPVTVHFTRKTKVDYLSEAYSKVCKIHARLPPGGVLVFLTSQQEIHTLCRKLEKRFGKQALEGRKARRAQFLAPNGIQNEDAPSFTGSAGVVETDDVDAAPQEPLAPDVDEAEGVAPDEDEEALDTSDEEDEENEGLQIFDDEDSDSPMHILPLYSLLPTDKQMRVFAAPPEGSRLVVVATNVAETSLTIPNIRYVVDCGRAKERHHDLSNGMQSYRVGFVSKASAAQRTGRAGRTGPGHCYRLYSSAVFESYFETHAPPEILRMPVDGVVLQMKSMGLQKVANFPFPTPPDSMHLSAAERSLTRLGALDTSAAHAITPLGRTMSLFPLAPRFSRMLAGAATSTDKQLLPYLIAMVCALSVGELFIREDNITVEHSDEDGFESEVDAELKLIRDEELRAKAQRKAARAEHFKSLAMFEALGGGVSDIFTMLAAVCAFEYEAGAGSEAFCRKHSLRQKAMIEVHKLREQITRLVATSLDDASAARSTKLAPPDETQLRALRQLLTASFIDQVAVRKDLVDSSSGGARFSSTRGVAYRAMNNKDDVFIHPSSSLFHDAPPDFVIYTELVMGSRPWLKGVTRIERAWLSELGSSLCTVTLVQEKHAAAVRQPAEGDATRTCVVRRTFDAGGLDIDLGVEQRQQKLEKGRWVLI